MSETTYLDGVEVEPETEARAAVIWLHGLGASGHDFEPIVPYLGLEGLGVRFFFPHAPRRPVSINMGMVMPAWYDVRTLELGTDPDREGIEDAARRVRDLIRRENERGIATNNIVLGGFSQGAAIALYVGLRYPERFAGICALSTYLIVPETLEAEASAVNRDVPILQGHGTLDPMVQHTLGEASRDQLKELGYDVEWKSYPMGHEVCPQEIQDLGQWLTRRFER